jgi:hypothetical protein
MRRSREDIGLKWYGVPVLRTFSAATSAAARSSYAHRAAILAVETDLLVLAGSKVQHLERKEFKGAQQFSAAVEQERGIGAGEVDKNFRLLPVAILGERRVDNNAVFEAKTAMGDDGLKELVDFIGGGYFVHKKLSAISRQSGTA